MYEKLSKKKRTWLASLGFLILLCIWVAVSLLVGETRMPLPTTVAYRFVTSAFSNPQIQFQGAGSHGFMPHVLASLLRYLIGVLSGTALSFLCLFLIARYKLFSDLFIPLVDVLRAIPPLALAPFFLLWFGTSQGGIIAIIVFYSFTMIFVAGAEALERIDPVLANFTRTMGASETVIARHVILPSLLPAMAGPIRVAYSWSWGLVIVAELLGAHSGIGRILNAFIALLATDLVVVGILWVLLLALGMERVVDRCLNSLLRWHSGEEVYERIFCDLSR